MPEPIHPIIFLDLDDPAQIHLLLARALGERPLPSPAADADYAKDFLEDKTGEFR